MKIRIMVGLSQICVNMDEEKSREKQGKTKRKTKGRGRGKRKKEKKGERKVNLHWVSGWVPQTVEKY